MYKTTQTSNWGSIAQWLGFLLPDPAAPGSLCSIPKKNSEEKSINLAEVNQWCWLEESGQWLENLDLTHLVLASGKPVLQKTEQTLTRIEGLLGTGGDFVLTDKLNDLEYKIEDLGRRSEAKIAEVKEENLNHNTRLGGVETDVQDIQDKLRAREELELVEAEQARSVLLEVAYHN